ncbi:MAG: SUMF1/EgtB/PvdO family nonheme iron enzyme [Planctomycetota bacterium]
MTTPPAGPASPSASGAAGAGAPVVEPPRASQGEIRSATVFLPPTVMMMGQKIENVAPWIRAIDKERSLCIGNILDSTPPTFVFVNPFYMQKRMVTNGEYRSFLHYVARGQEMPMFNYSGIWRHIWEDIKLRVDRVEMPYERAEGDIQSFEEVYDADVQNFVEAYIMSIKFEIQRLLLATETREEAALSRIPEAQSRQEVLDRVIFVCKYFLRLAIFSSNDEYEFKLPPFRLQELGRFYTENGSRIITDIHYLLDQMKVGYSLRVDRRYRNSLERGSPVTESQKFLFRLMQAVRQLKSLEQPIPLNYVLYPRSADWTNPFGEAEQRAGASPAARSFSGGGGFGGGGFGGGGGGGAGAGFGGGGFSNAASARHDSPVPWKDRPVTGITLFEAAAYCSFLAELSGLNIRLPNEAEFERCASWPLNPLDLSRKNGPVRVEIDPRQKMLFPWEDRNKKEFNFFFGTEGKTLAEFYMVRKSEWEKLLLDTCRDLGKDKESGDPQRIDQLLGFGWHWTIDRYHEFETKYSRFDKNKFHTLKSDANVSVFVPNAAVPGMEAPAAETEVETYVYESLGGSELPFYVLRGAPEILGGPGLSMRRFAAYPLRGAHNIGFRYIVQG